MCLKKPIENRAVLSTIDRVDGEVFVLGFVFEDSRLCLRGFDFIWERSEISSRL